MPTETAAARDIKGREAALRILHESQTTLTSIEDDAVITVRAIDAYIAITGDPERLVEALEALVNEIPLCSCIDAYKDRNRDDPSCCYHQVGDEVIQPATALLAELKGKSDAE